LAARKADCWKQANMMATKSDALPKVQKFLKEVVTPDPRSSSVLELAESKLAVSPVSGKGLVKELVVVDQAPSVFPIRAALAARAEQAGTSMVAARRQIAQTL
jgi:hypothetical protein